jgi:SAM-dependent methyltransferase
VDLKEEEILGDQIYSHWYYRAKRAVLLRELRGRVPAEVLDIGAGSGYFSRILLEAGADRAVCVDSGYPEDRDDVWDGKPVSFRRSIQSCNADLVLAMDVMEHVADETFLMRPYIDLVKPGTRFIVSVPAFQFLWSEHDVFLEHHRRYTLRTLEKAVKACGVKVDWSHYYYAGVFPLAAGMRLLERIKSGRDRKPKSQLKRHGTLQNSILSAICSVERPLMRANRLFGLTAFAAGHKP